MIRQEPDFFIPRSSLNLRCDGASNVLAIQKEFERVASFMRRLYAWQCVSCREIFPQDTPDFFGACRQCWEQDEDLDQRIAFDQVRDETVAINFRKWIREARFYDHLIHQLPGGSSPRCPVEVDWLELLFGWIGEERVWKAVSQHGRARADERIPDPREFRWYEGRGFAAIGTDLTDLPHDRHAPLPTPLRQRIEQGYRAALRKP